MEPAQPIHANLIEFPREIVATRKVRPRLAEGPFARAVGQVQLSIFEVDPGTISMEPWRPIAVDAAAMRRMDGSGVVGHRAGCATRREFSDPVRRNLRCKQAQVDGTHGCGIAAVELAPMSLRLMAAVVNGSLMMGAFLAAVAGDRGQCERSAVAARERGRRFRGAVRCLARSTRRSSTILAKGTPGMRYAGISLCTFDGQNPTRAQRCRRLVALLLSVLPVGPGRGVGDLRRRSPELARPAFADLS